MKRDQAAHEKKMFEEMLDRMLEGIRLTAVEEAVLQWFKGFRGVCLGAAMVLANKKKWDRGEVE